MAINRISGNILADNLIRGADLAIQGNLIYFDVADNRVGILNSSPTVAFDVTGNILGSNVTASNNLTTTTLIATSTANIGNITIGTSVIGSNTDITLTPTGNVFVSNVHISDVADPVSAQDAATKNYVDGALSSFITFEDDAGNTTGISAGDTVFFNGTANEINVVVSSLAVGFSLPSNVIVGNSVTACVLIANSVAASSGKLSLGSNANITISGGSNNYVLFTDGAGNLSWNPINSIGNLTVTDTTIGTVVGNTNIVLEPTGNGLVVIDTITGLTVPVGNTAQRPGSPGSGTVRFNTSTLNLEIYDGFSWTTAGGGNTFTITNQTISPDGSTTVYTLNQDATSASILLTINGVNQTPDIDYSVAGNALTMAATPLSSDLIQVRFLAGITTNNTMTNSSGNAVITVDVTGNIDLEPSILHSINAYGNVLPSANVTYDLGSTALRWKDLWLSGSTLTLGNVVIKNSSDNSISFYGPDGVTPANNITGGNLSVSTVTVGNIVNSNANGVGNIGSSSTYFNTVFAQSTSAQYADLAEKFISDQEYPPGTVLSFDGVEQVTACNQYADSRVAGIVTTNPAYLMNAGAAGTTVSLALAGQVPCLVVGPVNKGDLLTTSSTSGHACRLDKNDWTPGAILAKALESCDTGMHKILVFTK